MIAHEIAPYRLACVGTGLLWPDDWERPCFYLTPRAMVKSTTYHWLFREIMVFRKIKGGA